MHKAFNNFLECLQVLLIYYTLFLFIYVKTVVFFSLELENHEP